MSGKAKLLIGVAVAGVLALALVVGAAGFWFVSGAFAQGATSAPDGAQDSCHDNQSVFQLLKLGEQQLLAQRQAGKSLLDIAQAQGVDEARLTNALVQPINGMHSGAQANTDPMTQPMKDQFVKDLRESKFGTMTDYHLGLGGDGVQNMMSGTGGQDMMGGANASGVNGTGMMENVDHDSMMGNVDHDSMMGNSKR